MTRNENKFNLIEQIRSDLSNTIDAIINHQYLDALEKKEINRVKLEIFVCEQYQIISNDKRNFAFMISRASSDVASKLFIDCLDEELNALGNLTIMAEELIIDKRKIEAYEQLAGCQAYTNYLTRLAVYGSDAEIVTALLIDLPVWGANCSKISSILKKIAYTIIMTTVRQSVNTTGRESKVRVASIVQIADKIKNLHTITCDLCNTRRATYDVFINGVIKGIPILKRCCDNCVKSI